MQTSAFHYQEREYQRQLIMEGKSEGESSPVDDVEMARQLLQHHKIRTTIGGLLPGVPGLAHIRRVLDIGCGCGIWALDLASTYPDMEVVGIDKDPQVIAYATRQAAEGQLRNARFLVQDMNTLDENIIEPESFDLVNLAFISECLLDIVYPDLLRHLFTFCHPGGLLRWTEAAIPVTNSFAFEDLAMDIGGALREHEHSFYAIDQQMHEGDTKDMEAFDGLLHFAYQRFMGITHCLAPWLRTTGYQNVRLQTHTLDVSYGTSLHYSFVRQVGVLYQRLSTFLHSSYPLEDFEYDYLYSELIEDLQDRDFCGLCHLVSALGERPQA
ncbi:class I SAM-dependent methyltransferase [Ktedonospora formicarum]|uniref:Methyltransferase domain-containing protein n=1 Tax=Ktedonospora formicarum TaxID=2778364 RepID=A0A8J3HXF3_9CHLR|nr:class I SAM-dependent methyltransferase [Ktedonospora formicarum]GHO45006.1 hypothetical protein KSX_31690 [Ktedonospora formicarum]